MNLDEMAALMSKPGVTVMQFCGVEVDDENMCDQEAIGELTVPLEDGITIPVPVCKTHLDSIRAEFDVENIST